MSEAEYERYRSALRSGHLATLRGANEQAIASYGEAARLLPKRGAPHVALGGTYLATGRATEALTEFEAALGRSPDDTVALDGAARALLELDRADDAADVLDRLATIHLDHGRSVDALATIERATEIGGSPWRRMMLERLHGSRREEPRTALTWLTDRPDSAGETESAPTAADASIGPIPGDLRAIAEQVEAARGRDDVHALVAGARALMRADRLRAAAIACHDALSLAPADPEIHRTLAAIYRRRGWGRAARQKLRIVERYQRIVDDPDALEREGELALMTGDIDELLRVAAEHAANGRTATALDLLFAALATTPGDPRLYLAIARLHVALGWRRRAVAEAERLARYADATGDAAARESVAAFVNDVLRPGIRLAAPAY